MSTEFMTYTPADLLFQAVLKVINDDAVLHLSRGTVDAITSAHKAAKDAMREVQDNIAFVDKARELYSTDEIEIDDHPVLSVTDDGAWVSAWVWVAQEDLED